MYTQESDFDYEIEDEFGIDPESGEVVDFGGLSVNVQKNEQTGASGDEEEQEDLPESRIMENVDPEDSFVVETLSLQKGLGAPPASSEVLKLSADSAISEASKLQVSKSYPFFASYVLAAQHDASTCECRS